MAEVGTERDRHSEAYLKGACEQVPSPFPGGNLTPLPHPPPAPRGGDYMSLFGSGLKHTLAGRQLALAQA